MQIDAIPLSLKYRIKYPDNFIDSIKRGEIVATKCKNCNSVYFPPQEHCYNCGKSEMEWIKVSNEGELMTYSIVVQKPQGFENYEYYTIGIVKTKDNINLMAWIKGKPSVNAKVRLVTDGIRIIGEVVG